MPNEISFAVEFTREDMQQLIDNEGAAFVVITGNFCYQGQGQWDMAAQGEVLNSSRLKLGVAPKRGCPQPCP